MTLVTTDFITGKNLQTVTVVKGCIVFSKGLSAEFKGVSCGENENYTKLFNEARDTAVSRMIKNAILLNADGIINVRFSTSSISDSFIEVMAVGTAVKFI